MARRKRRIKSHVIADLSENHFERIALLKGYSVERTAHDYGYDVFLFSFDNEEIENGHIAVQLKASENLNYIFNNSMVSFPVLKKDLDLWLREFNPVILVLYDVSTKKAYWLYIQAYFKTLTNFSLNNVNKSINVRIPIGNIVGKGLMTKFSKWKKRLFRELELGRRLNHRL